MEVKYKLNKMDAIRNKMLEADWNSYRWSLILKAQDVYKRLEKDGHLGKIVGMSKSIQMQKEMMMGRAMDIINNIDNIMTYDIRPLDETTTELTVWMNKDYFIAEDIVKTKLGKRGSKVVRVIITRQSLLNQWRKAIKESYTHKFSGEILDDDGESLVLKT